MLRRTGPAGIFLALALGIAQTAGMAGPASASAQAVTVSGNQFLVNGQPFVPIGFNSIALLNSTWCSSKLTKTAAQNFGSNELKTAMSSWNANTVRFQVSQPVLAGPDGAAYAQQIQNGVQTASNLGLAVIVSMQDESLGCGQSQPLPSQQTENAWATLIGNTTLSSDPGVMFELFNEPQNSTSTAASSNPQQETWADWLNGGRQIEPTSSQSWTAYTPVGHQQLVDYLRGTLGVTNVLIADGAANAESLQGLPVLTDPGSSNQIAYGVHLYAYGQGPAGWYQRWGYLASSYPVIATEWNYPASACGTSLQAMAPQFLSYARNTVNVGILGQALDIYSGDLMAGTSLAPTQCGTSAQGSGNDFLTGYLDTFPPSGAAAPAPPSGVTATDPATDGVTLSWDASTDPNYDSSDLTYSVYRNGVLAGTTAAGVTSFTDTGASPATSYLYTVTATDPSGYTSSPSAVLSQQTLSCPAPAAPAGLAVTGTTSSSVSLSWQAVTPGAPACAITRYIVKRNGTTAGSTATTSYTDTSVAAGTKYSYKVQAEGTGGLKGAFSATVTARTPAS